MKSPISDSTSLVVAREVHDRAIVIDAQGGSSFSVSELRRGGVTAFNHCVTWSAERAVDTLQEFARCLEIPVIYPDAFLLVEHVQDIDRAKRENKTGLILGFQGMSPIGHGLYWIRILHKLGLRIGGLVYNENSVIGGSCAEASDPGLTFFGRQVVHEMNRLGIVIDVSHTGDRTSLEAVGVSGKPIILTHSNPRRLVDHPRNVPDELIKAIASRNGVIGISQYAPLLESKHDGLPTVETWLEHIDYAVQLVGIDHVGIGTDSEIWSREMWVSYMIRYRDLVPKIATYMAPAMIDVNTHNVQGYSGPQDLHKVTTGLLSRGYTSEDVEKVLGRNFLRVFSEVW